MELKIIKTGMAEVQAFRVLFLKENNFQFIHNKCHENNWADTWIFIIDRKKVGYGAIWGIDRREDRNTIFEFYLTERYKKSASLVFEKFCTITGATLIECQSNDILLSSMLYEFAQNINAEAILFEDHFQTSLAIADVIFGGELAADDESNNVGDYFLKQSGEIVASGGFMLNYNKPYADIYMEVKAPFRQKGLGSLIIQELKKEIYLMGRYLPPGAISITRHQKQLY
jgi:hypothetical protein